MNKYFQVQRLPVVLITGCASGLGLALARLLYIERRHIVIATTRTEASSEKLKDDLPPNDLFSIETLDVTNTNQRESLIAKIFRRWKAVDVLINNAGVSYRSVIEHMDDESEYRQMDINYLSPMALIRLVIPNMREKGAGKIINVSSVSGMVSMPTMASYSASKHALEGATEALWYELKPYGINVSLIQPGFIRSLSFEKVCFSKKASLSQNPEGPYSEYYNHMGKFVARLMQRSRSTPDSIANQILQVIDNPRPPLWIPVTLDAVIFYWLRKLLPRYVFHKAMFQLLPNVKCWGQKNRDLYLSNAR